MLQGIFNGRIILELPFTQEEAVFSIQKEGVFALWISGKLLTRTPIGYFEPKIVQAEVGTALDLFASVLSPRINGWKTGRMEWKRFTAAQGNYRLELMISREQSVMGRLSTMVWSDLPPDVTHCTLQVRESQATYLGLVAILLIVLAAGGIIGGLVLGLLAGQLFVV
ncbi:hypothetical protein DBR32_01935 [Taibaiella sp. KBW10]|uniref:hypothetical protein n=1 Tax=Taibaiella sp. KBW10 TaxID=2153357 RepID=UPI000F5B47D3|nr:hypothetical protein [Taibaiella sp. KBW10]RQO32388.1 hypothetical protein DBR32_01935 [Taibaiella sp. KBW10]